MVNDIYLDHDTTEESLAAQLPEYMPKDPESGNFKLLSTIAERLDALDSDVKAVDRASTVQYADSVDQLEQLAELVDLKPYQNETKEHFRARVISEFQLVTSEGTVNDLLNATSTILDTPVDTIRYTEEHVTQAGTCQLSVPSSKLKNIELSNQEFSGIVDQLIPSSYYIEILSKGTFTYLSSSSYGGSSTSYDPTALISDSDLGHDGLDSGGNPKDTGGTYAGVLQ